MSEQLRHNMVLAGRVLERRGMVSAFGHVSARYDANHFLITGQTGPGQAMPEALLTVELASGKLVAGQGSLPLETPMHQAIYQRRADVQAICRSHPPYACAWGSANRELAPAHGFGAFLGACVSVYPDTDLIRTSSQANRLVDTLSQARAVLLRGNGVVVTGENVRTACIGMLWLEESAQLGLLALPLGGVKPWTGDELAARAAAYSNEIERAWAYELTQLSS
jgi:HCOMODA/2-hydroxy-3-carboxy-muconic semialdehyde decarboxylase